MLARGKDEGALTRKEVRETVALCHKVNRDELVAIFRSIERKRISLLARRSAGSNGKNGKTGIRSRKSGRNGDKTPTLRQALAKRKADPKNVMESDVKFSHDIKIDDSVKIYLREIGWVPLLSS